MIFPALRRFPENDFSIFLKIGIVFLIIKNHSKSPDLDKKNTPRPDTLPAANLLSVFYSSKYIACFLFSYLAALFLAFHQMPPVCHTLVDNVLLNKCIKK